MKTKIIEKIAALATAAFGLVAALAWNSAIQEIFKKYYGAGEGIGALIAYAIIVTIIAVLITIWIGKAADKAKNLTLKDKILAKAVKTAKSFKRK
jgi:hypothetical protein